jgi:hypothetical protein
MPINRVSVLLASMAVAAWAWALLARTARRASETELGVQQQREASLGKAVARVERRVAELERERVQDEAALAAAKEKRARAAVPPARKTAGPQALVALRDDPRSQTLLLAQKRAELAESYRGLVVQLRLSPTQAAQLIDDLVERATKNMDIVLTMSGRAPTDHDKAIFLQLQEQAEGTFRAHQVALLGEAGYEALVHYRRTLPLRDFVDTFAGQAAVAGVGITAAQADALIKAMANASSSYRSGRDATIQRLDWPGILEYAAAELSAAQFALFKKKVVPRWNMERLEKLASQR